MIVEMDNRNGQIQTSNKSYSVAELSEEEERMIRQLETKLGVVLIAYEDK